MRHAIRVLAVAIALGPVAATAADHLDGPRLMANPTNLGNLDINDVYVFRAFNPHYTVLIMTLSPAAGVLGPAHFSTIGAYEFKIENNGDAIEDLTIRFTFGGPNKLGQQSFRYVAVDAADRIRLSGKGVSGQTTTVPGGGMVRPDLYDDPFFFDLNAFNLFKARALAGDPTAGAVFLNRGVKNIPQNFFGGFNVMAIVLEVPRILLQSSKADTMIGVWARTLLPGDVQFDRMARPAINTVLLPDIKKDDFNSAVPAHDTSFIDIASEELTKLFGNEKALVHATLLLPDIMTFDTSSSQGFLNGRRPIDDVIDAELDLLSNNVVTSDGVVNDSVFSTKFPYLGKPNPKRPTIQRLQVAAQGQNAGNPAITSSVASNPLETPSPKTAAPKKKTVGSNSHTGNPGTSSARTSNPPDGTNSTPGTVSSQTSKTKSKAGTTKSRTGTTKSH